METNSSDLEGQFRLILQKYTKSTKIAEMVAELLDVVTRSAPKVIQPVPIMACQHINKLGRDETGKGILTCKKCGHVEPINKG